MFAKCLCIDQSPSSEATLEVETEDKPPVKPFFRKKGGIKLITKNSQTQLQTDNECIPEAMRRKRLGSPICFLNLNVDKIKERLRRDHPTKFNLLPDEVKAQNSQQPTTAKPTTQKALLPTFSLQSLCIPCPPLHLPFCHPTPTPSKKHSTTQTHISDPPFSKLDKYVYRRTSSISTDQINPLSQSLNDQIIEQVVPIVEESVIVARTVMDGFEIVRKVAERDGYQVCIAVERNIGMVVGLKVVKEMDMGRVVEEVGIYRGLGEGHPGVLRLYNGVVDATTNSYVMIREYYSTTLRDLVVTQTISKDQLREYMKQLLQVFQYLCSKGVQLPHLNLQDIAIVNGLCKLTNLQNHTFLEPDSEPLNIYYIRRLTDIIKSVMSIGSFMASALGEDLFGCSSFVNTLETERSLREIARHRYFNRV